MSIKDIAEIIIYRSQTIKLESRPFIVGIDGLGGSGKTTLVKKLNAKLNMLNCEVVPIHIDEYIVKKNRRYQTGFEEWYEYYYLQWDVEKLKNDLFLRLSKQYNKLNLPFYDDQTDSISTKEIIVNPNSVVLVEGVFIQRKEWREFFDFILFTDCSQEVRMERVLNRDIYIGDYQTRLNKYKKRYWLGEEHYLNIENPIKNADKILNTTLYK